MLTVDFQVGSVTSISANAYEGVVADFNKDGIPDLATPHETSPFVSVLMGLGNGTFASPVNYSTGSGGYGIKAADLDADGFLDLASVNANSNTVSVLWGTTLGRFLAPSTVSVGSYPDGLTIADFNADGRLDIITANFTGNSMSVVYGNGTRSLSSALNVGAVGNGPDGPAHGDFNGDGVLDVAVANWYDGQVAILRGQIGAGFYPLATYSTGANPVNPIVGDLNSDGKLDIVVNNWSSNTVSVLLGNATGSFAVTTYSVGSTPNLTRISDINNDGSPDLLVANAVGDSISILLGTGNGTFIANSPAQYPVGDAPRDALVADFDGNGTKDIAVPASLSSNVTILLNQAPATNHRPVANSDVITTAFQTAISFNVLSNDSDPDGQSLTVALFSAPAHGTVTVSANGAAVYTPASGYSGNDSFQYTASDGLSGTITVVSITVNAPNQAPTSVPGGPYSVVTGSTIHLNGSGSFDPEGGQLTYEWDLAYNGVAFNADQTGAVVPFDASGFTSATQRTVALRVTDPVGLSSISTTTVSILGTVSRWRFTEGSGTSALDSAGTNHGALLNGPTWTSGVGDGALSFDGINDYVAVPDSNSLDIVSALTMETWVRMNAIDNNYETFIWKTDPNTAPGRAYSLARIRNDGSGASWAGRFYSTIFTSSGRAEIESAIMPQAGQWYHVVSTYDGSSHKLYVNGVLQASQSFTGAIVTTSGDLLVGRATTAGSPNYLRGSMEEAAVYNRALTPAEVQDHYAALNLKPIANAGGSYAVSAGSAVVLNGLTSRPRNGALTAYEWDFDYDGVTFQADATGATPLFSVPSEGATSTKTIALRVTDSANAQAIDTTTIAIKALRSQLGLVATTSENRVNSTTGAVQQYPSLAMSATGASVISWESGSPGTVDVDIASQRFDANGLAVGSEFQNNDPATSERVRASSAIADDGRFVVGWQGWGADGQDWGINAKRYNSDGTQYGSQFIASWNQTGSQSDIQLAIAPSGNTFVVLWEDSYQDGSGSGVYFRLFTWAGDTISTGRVNNVTSGYQGNCDVLMLSDGSFVVSWMSANVDGAGYGIVARRFSANGTPLDANEFQVNTVTAGDQYGAVLANLNGTGFLIAWTTASDGAGSGVFAQRFDTQWNRVGSEFRVNETTSGTQQDPSISVTPNGKAVISWSSLGQDGSGWSVYARALQLDTMEFGPETLVNVTTAGDQYSFGIRGAIATNPAGISTIVWNGNGTGDSTGIFRRQFAIAADQNQAPTLNLSPSGLLLPENADTSQGITVSSLNISDDGFGSNVLSISGADAGAFEIAGTSLRLKAGTVLDFETKQTFTVTVSVDDSTVGGTPDDSETFTLTITDVNEAPSISITPVITSLPESTSTASPLELATITVADDALGSNVLFLSGADAGAFEIVGPSLRLKAGVLLDHESKAIFNVTVNVDDNSVGGTPDSSVNYVLSITDSDEWVIVEPNQRSTPAYGGVGNNDHVQIVVSLSEALTPAIEAAFDAFQAHLDAGLSDTTFILPVLNISLSGFEHFDRLLSYGSFRGIYDNPIAGNNYSETLTGTVGRDLIAGNGGNDTIFGLGGADIIIGASGDDSIDGGEGDDTYLYSGAANGFDTLMAGVGYDKAIAVSAGTVIGLNGYANGVEEFVGLGDTIIRDTAYSKTLDFSNTVLTGIAEIDAAGGNDVVTASNLSPGVYRGGSGDDILNAGSTAVTWKYSGTSNGFDSLNNGSGVTLAVVESTGTVIGVNGYINGVDEFVGLSDTIIRDTAYSKTLDFSNTILTGIAEIDAAGGNDVVTASNLSPGVYRGGAGDDVLNAGSTAVTWKYSGTSNGFDTLNNGSGTTLAVVESTGTVMGVNGYINGVDEFVGLGDTIIRDTAYSKTLDFSNTILTGIAEIDAAGGNDVVTASNLSPGVYRGGAGDDILNASSTAVTWKYSGTSNGFDTLNNGSGTTLAVVESAGTVIGVNGYVNGVDEFVGLGDTIIRDTAYSKTLDFSNTVLTSIAEVDAAGGNDVVTASNLSPGVYRGGAGDDVLNAGSTAVTWKYSGTSNGFDTLNNGSGTTQAVVESAGTVIGVNGYINGVDEFVGLGDTIIRDTAYSKTLDFSNTVLTGIAEVDAAGGNDMVTASRFSSTLYRLGTGDDTLLILNTTLAQVKVADFKQSGRDRIDLRTFGISNRLAGLTRTQSGADTLVSGPPNLNLRLLDTLFGSLVDADFLF